MADHEKHDHKHEPGRSAVATFGSRAEAREAIAALHKAHYTHTWLGVTSLAETDRGDETLTVESQQGGFFSGSQSLVDALVGHGVLGDTARALETEIEPGEALVTVDPKDKDLAEPISILEQHGGRIAGRGTMQPGATMRPPRTGAAVGTVSGDDFGDDVAGETFYRRTALKR